MGASSDTDTAPGDYDGNGASFSAQALAAAGASPGAPLTADGITFTWPSAAAGTPDNTAAGGQYVAVGGSGSELGFLVSASWGPVTATGEIVYTDGSTQSYTLTVPDWQSGSSSSGTVLAVTAAYQNRPDNRRYDEPSYVFATLVPLTAGKTIAWVQLPDVSAGVTEGQPALPRVRPHHGLTPERSDRGPARHAFAEKLSLAGVMHWLTQPTIVVLGKLDRLVPRPLGRCPLRPETPVIVTGSESPAVSSSALQNMIKCRPACRSPVRAYRRGGPDLPSAP